MGKGNMQIEKIVKSLEQGAATTIWAALDKRSQDKGGLYIDDCQISQLATPGLALATPGMLSTLTIPTQKVVYGRRAAYW